MLLNSQQITEELKQEIKVCIETNDNENSTTQNLWDSVKAVLRGKFIAIQTYLKKQGKHQVNNLTLHLKQLKKKKKERNGQFLRKYNRVKLNQEETENLNRQITSTEVESVIKKSSNKQKKNERDEQKSTKPKAGSLKQ